VRRNEAVRLHHRAVLFSLSRVATRTAELYRSKPSWMMKGEVRTHQLDWVSAASAATKLWLRG
jgi:hypothetical protein